jgi:acetyl esterase/lipase
VGRAFFAKDVVMPYLRVRMWRSNYSGPGWSEVRTVGEGIRGLWISHYSSGTPDVVIYYLHGGGFTMGSTYFYLEFLLLWCEILREAGFVRPAVFALEYSRVPEKVWPTQLAETVEGYRYVRSRAEKERVVLAGDSAGAMLVLSLLLYLRGRDKAAFVVLISPWTKLLGGCCESEQDFLDTRRLRELGLLYAGDENPYTPLVSPGDCMDEGRWRESLPAGGIGFYWGSQEVFAPGIAELSQRLARIARVLGRERQEVHCWPVAAMFLEASDEQRCRGLREMSADIVEALRGRGQ